MYTDIRVKIPEDRVGQARSSCLRVGAYMVLRKIIAEYHMDEMLAGLIGKDGGLFLDLAAYSIVTEGKHIPEALLIYPSCII